MPQLPRLVRPVAIAVFSFVLPLVTFGLLRPVPAAALMSTSGQYRSAINALRVRYHLPALIFSYTLNIVASQRVRDMATIHF